MTERYIPVEVERAALLRVLNDASDTRLASVPDVMWGASRVLLVVRELMEGMEPRPATIDDLWSGPVQRDLRDLGVEELDQAHLDEPLTGRVTFIWIEKMRDEDALRHLREIHHVPPNFRDGEMAAVHEQHTKLHPTESHCHAKGGERTIEVIPLMSMLNDMQAMHHMSAYHSHTYVLGPINTRQGLDSVHAGLHEGLADHEHRRA